MLSENVLATIATKHGLSRRSSSDRSRPEEIAGIVFSAAETMGGAFAMGWLNGRFQSAKKDHLQVFGLPADLTIGTMGLITSIMGIYGPLNSHVASLAAGAAATYFARTGLTYGSDAKTAAVEKLAAQASGGMLPSGGTKVVTLVTKKEQPQEVAAK